MRPCLEVKDMQLTNKLLIASLLAGPALLMSACNDSGNSSNSGEKVIETGLPGGLNLSLLNAVDGAFYNYNTSSEIRLDLNEQAASSQDSAVQQLMITDTSVIGHFMYWADGELDHDHDTKAEEDHDHEEGELETWFLLMRPSYQPGSPVDADQFVFSAHFHGDELAAHSAEQYRNPEPGSNVAEGLERLNHYVEEQAALQDEVAEALTSEGETLCRAYVDPYVLAELAHDEEEHEGEAAKAEGDEHEEVLVHYALSDSGRMYFFEEHEGALESMQGFVKLDDTSSIQDCSRTTIARVSEEGVLVFVPDTQKLYLVDSHDGGDFHQHSSWEVSDILPNGVRADLIAILGEGEEHDHDHAE